MKKRVLAVLLLLSVAALRANALLIMPTDPSLVMTGNETSNAKILSILDAYFATLGEDIFLLYKAEVDSGGEEGVFAPFYSTFFSPPGDVENALITWVGPYPNYINSDYIYLLVKDGNHRPAWYFFNLKRAGWDGREDLELRRFWPRKGSISHVTIFGSESKVSVPDGGTTLALLGLALMALAGAKRCLVG